MSAYMRLVATCTAKVDTELQVHVRIILLPLCHMITTSQKVQVYGSQFFEKLYKKGADSVKGLFRNVILLY